MRHVQGLVCLVEVEGQQLLFTYGEPEFRAVRLESRNLETFPDERSATKARDHLLRKYKNVSCGMIKMSVPEAEAEVELFRGERDLIVLSSFPDGDMELYGPVVKDRPDCRPLPCAFLRENGMKTFRSFSEAKSALVEVQRQLSAPCTLARFRFDKIPTLEK